MPLRSDRPDTRSVEFVDHEPAGGPLLTPAQMRFAREHRARPMFARDSDGSVSFYRVYYGGTDRWLVGSEGEVLHVEHFPADAVARAEGGVPHTRRKPRIEPT
jgi:hypothetical protein